MVALPKISDVDRLKLHNLILQRQLHQEKLNAIGIQGFTVSGTNSWSFKGQTTIEWGIGDSIKMVLDNSGRVGIGTTSPAEKLDVTGNVKVTDGYVQLKEISDPSAPPSNEARLFVRDNGSGKTELCVLFPSGAVQVIKTEP